MACCRNVMLLVDTAGGAAGQSLVRRAALRLLIYLSCRFGLARVRWAFRFFDSQGARSRPSRVSDFRELGTRSWEDFEEELEARLGDGAPGAHLPGPAPRATHTHSALMETLLDYQWDRPEITSPTKPVLRSSSSSRRRLVDVESEAKEAETALGGFGNAVFLLAPCPHSQRELLQFLSGCEAQAQRLSPTPKQVMEKLLPKRVQEVMAARKITLYWVDTSERSKLWDSPDHLGYWTVCGLLHHVGGTILPSGTFSQPYSKAGETQLARDKTLSHDPHLSPWISTLPTDSTLNRLLHNSPEYDASFPRMEGTLFLPVEGKEVQEAWVVTLEPLTMHQRHFQKPVRIFLKGTATQWSLPMSSTLGTDSWMLQSPGENKSTQRMLFQQLVNRLTAEELHLVASVEPGAGWPPITAVISPLSTDATVLTVLRTQEVEFQGRLLQTVVAEDPPGTACLLSETVDVVLNQIHNLPEAPATPAAPAVPTWARQELGRTASGSVAMEQWFRRSNLSGASSDLMESFWLLQAASSGKEESSKTESELTCRLSELYLRKSREEPTMSNQEDSKKKRGVPRTPVWRKMSSMCRSLKMLNVARLNVKAQKSHPDGSPDAAGEKGIQRTGSRRTADKLENRGRALRSSKPKDFKTEEELLSYIHENYQKAVATGGTVLYSCAQNMIATIKAFLKSKGTKDLEVSCLNQVKNNLLKTSRSLRQNVGKKLDKEDKVRECQLQVFLRLEMCLQCPSIPERIADMEQVVEEVVDLLRMVCLAEDSVYLAKFLEEILGLYIDSLPKTLGSLYHSLGFVMPQRLLGVLPVDFLSDDSMTQDSKSPPLSVPQRSVSGGTESEQLEELRTRSARKRRKNALRRHKSIADVSQNLRQIEIPRVSKRATQNENSRPALQQPPGPVKDTVQEVTKVRRNLFNQEISPSKRSGKRGMPRSHSVSAVEGLEYKLDNVRTTKGYHRLLTKSVAETPVHKQSSRRLIHRQVKGRSSDPGPEIDVVEESPEKGELNLRRSPRIKQLSLGRTNSSSFYSVSQPKSRSVQRAHSFQQDQSDQRENSSTRSIQTPKRFFFGAVSDGLSPSEKRPAGITQPSGNTEDSETRPAYQTPKKSHWKPPSSSTATPRHAPRTPKSLRGLPAAPTPARRNGASPSPQKGHPVPEGGASPRGRTPRTRGQPPGLPSVTPSPEQPSHLAAPAARTGHAGPTPGRCSLGSPPRAAAPGGGPDPAVLGTPPTQKRQQPRGPRAPQPEGPKWKREGATAPKRPEHTTVTSSPPVFAEEASTSPFLDTSKSPLGSSSLEPPAPGLLDWTEHPTPPSGAPCPPRAATSTPAGRAQTAGSDVITPVPPPEVREGHRDSSSAGSSFPRGQRPPAGAGTDSLGARQDQQEGEPSAQPPAGHTASPLLGAGGTQRLPLLAEAGNHSTDDVSGSACPEEEVSQMPAAEEPPLSHPGVALSPPASEPSSPLTPPCVLRRVAHRSLQPLDGGGEPTESPRSPPTYDVELEMQASGLPKLRLRKRDTEPLREDSALPGPSVPRASKASGKPEPAYTSPPCPHPAHSTPGKNGGQTYICQACTPTRGPSSTPCPFQTPQTPSPKCSGRTTPDALRDWPRRKRAGAAAGRAGVSTDLSACLSPLPPEDLDLGVSKAPVVGDFELEGVCQLPDLSPPRDGVLEAEEAFLWGQFGLGSRKRRLSAREVAEGEAKRPCEQQGGDARVGTSEERSPGLGADVVPVSGSSPPGCVTRSCLSASGLQALTRSPLLFQGKTPSSHARDADVDVFSPTAEDSLFSHTLSRRRATSRTYTRKKLIGP